jgi:hypothetical protein
MRLTFTLNRDQSSVSRSPLEPCLVFALPGELVPIEFQIDDYLLWSVGQETREEDLKASSSQRWKRPTSLPLGEE